jgi:outer membrane protein assembly factor BamB
MPTLQHRFIVPLLGGLLLSALAGTVFQRMTVMGASSAARNDPVTRLIATSFDAPAGLAVHVNFTDADRLIQLSDDGRYLVHGIATQRAALDAAREAIRGKELEGVVSVEAVGDSLRRLPYSDRLVNVLVVEKFSTLLEDGLPMEELLRVVAPGGTLWLEAGANPAARIAVEAAVKNSGIDQIEWIESDGQWAKLTRPREEAMDVWSHQRYDASGTASSRERALDVPTGVRWITGPNWATQLRKRAMQGVTASERRLVYFFQDEKVTSKGPRPQHALIARDAYNGAILWKRWLDFTPSSSLLVTQDERIYTVVESKGPLVGLDPQTGETVITYEELPRPSEVLFQEGRLLARVSDGIVCVEPATGEVLWKYETSGSDLLAAEDQVILIARGRRPDGKRESEIVCLDLDTGEPKWKAGTSSWSEGGSIKPILWYEGVLVFSGAKGNTGVSTKDGSHLWTYEYERIGHGGSYAKILAFDGLVWVHPANSDGTKQNAWEGLDPQTGQIARRYLQPEEFRLRHKCHTDRASGRQILCGALELVDVDSGEHQHFAAARNSCSAGGLLPANGLLYTFPHACHCYPMLRGFIGLATKPDPVVEDSPIEIGTVTADSVTSPPADPADWPTFRGNSRRAGSTTAAGPQNLRPVWEVSLAESSRGSMLAEWPFKEAGRMTSPVIANGMLYVAAVDAHRLEALDAETGEPGWTFIADGRIDTPPTIHNGLCLFGARDGRVYCLRAADGRLVWKTRVAPTEERIVAYGQLESNWPVVGGVLVHEGIAYACAGRHSHADGGIHVTALDPASGERLWQAQPDGFNGLADLLVGGDDAVHMISWEFDAKTGENASSSREEYLRASRLGLVSDSWYRRPIALRKSGQQWSMAGQRGQLLSFDDERLYGYLAGDFKNPGKGFNSGAGPLEGAARLFGSPLSRQGSNSGWEIEYPQGSQIRSMVLAGERLFIAGRLEGSEEQSQSVHIISAAEGRELAAEPLSAAPVHDGLAVAGRKLYLALEDGRVLCLGTE